MDKCVTGAGGVVTKESQCTEQLVSVASGLDTTLAVLAIDPVVDDGTVPVIV